MKRGAFKFWDLVRLILETLRYVFRCSGFGKTMVTSLSPSLLIHLTKSSAGIKTTKNLTWFVVTTSCKKAIGQSPKLLPVSLGPTVSNYLESKQKSFALVSPGNLSTFIISSVDGLLSDIFTLISVLCQWYNFEKIIVTIEGEVGDRRPHLYKDLAFFSDFSARSWWPLKRRCCILMA